MEAPLQPYVFRAGKFPGRSIEALVFSKFGYINFLYQKLNAKPASFKNELHTHLEWLMKKLNLKIASNIACPYCGQKATHFLIPGFNYPITDRFVCCDSPHCKDKLKDFGDRQARLHSFNLLVFSEPLPSKQKRQLVALYKTALGFDLSGLSEDKVFQVLKQIPD